MIFRDIAMDTYTDKRFELKTNRKLLFQP